MKKHVAEVANSVRFNSSQQAACAVLQTMLDLFDENRRFRCGFGNYFEVHQNEILMLWGSSIIHVDFAFGDFLWMLRVSSATKVAAEKASIGLALLFGENMQKDYPNISVLWEDLRVKKQEHFYL